MPKASLKLRTTINILLLTSYFCLWLTKYPTFVPAGFVTSAHMTHERLRFADVLELSQCIDRLSQITDIGLLHESICCLAGHSCMKPLQTLSIHTSR